MCEHPLAAAEGAQAVCAYVVLTVIPHYEPFDAAIGTELAAPAALGLLLEAVRAALRSPTASLSLGNVALPGGRGVVVAQVRRPAVVAVASWQVWSPALVAPAAG